MTRSQNFIAYYYHGANKYLHRGNSIDVTDTSKLMLSNYQNHSAYSAFSVFRAPVVEYYGGDPYLSTYTEFAYMKVRNMEQQDAHLISLHFIVQK